MRFAIPVATTEMAMSSAVTASNPAHKSPQVARSCLGCHWDADGINRSVTTPPNTNNGINVAAIS